MSTPRPPPPDIPSSVTPVLPKITCTRRGGQHDLSMKLLASMVGANLTPDIVTVGELISSLSDRGRWDEARRVLDIASRTGAIPPSSLDGDFEVDVSNLPAAVAKVKVSAALAPLIDGSIDFKSD